MVKEEIYGKKIELMGSKYLVYLESVSTKILPGGKPEATAMKAFVRKISD